MTEKEFMKKMKRQLVGVSEVAKIAKVEKGTISMWRKRYKKFPKPIVELACGPIWFRMDIEYWLRNGD